jgi:ATP-binding cassette subfamily B protein
MLLYQTLIPVAIAWKYSALTNFFAQSSARRDAQSAVPAEKQSAPFTDIAPKQSSPEQQSKPAPMAITSAYAVWVVLTLSLLGLSFVLRYLTALFDQRVTLALRRDVFNRVLQQSPQFFHKNPSGRLLIMLTQFSTSAAMALRQLLIDPVLQVISILTVGYALYLKLSGMAAQQGNTVWGYFSVIALFAFISPWLVSRMGKAISRSTTNLQEQFLSMGSFLEGVLNAPEEIQTMRAEPLFDTKHQKLLNSALRARIEQTLIVERLNLLSRSPGDIVLIALLGLAVYLSFVPQSSLDPGTIIAFVYLTPQFMGSVQGISAFSINVSTSWPSILAIDSILESEPGIASAPNAKDFEWIEPTLIARDLVFSYQPGVLRKVLDGVSFEVPPGKITGFVARPGQGKTTFFRLLLRFYEPQRGEIVLGGHPIRDFTLQSLRRHVVLMSQFPAFFLDTLRENFLIAKSGATDDQIEALCRKTGLWSILEENLGNNPLDRQFVPSPGKSLSGGETKLLALTRCLLREPVVLLLDEPTTGMGPKEKFPLIPTMRDACQGETVLVVDHDIFWQTRFCDYFVVLSDGKIVQQGTSKQLLGRAGLFKELYDAVSEQESGSGSQSLFESLDGDSSF